MMGAAAAARGFQLSLAKASALFGLEVSDSKPAPSLAIGAVERATASFVNCSAACAGIASPKAMLAALSCCCAAACAAASDAAPVAPAFIKPSPKPAPPYAPNPAIRPRDKLPVAKVVRPPTVKPAMPADIMPPPKAKPAGPKNAPRAIGATVLKRSDNRPASGNPVSGLMVSVVPFASANC